MVVFKFAMGHDQPAIDIVCHLPEDLRVSAGLVPFYMHKPVWDAKSGAFELAPAEMALHQHVKDHFDLGSVHRIVVC
jgi:hypothetical protein